MSHVLVGHIARRGVQATTDYLSRDQQLQEQAEGWENLDYKMPGWGVAIIWATALLFYLLLVSIGYTIGDVIATLSIIEQPATSITISGPAAATTEPKIKEEEASLVLLYSAPLEKEAFLDVEQTVTVAHAKPITSKLRTTLRHLTAHGGFTARWRGLGIAILYNIIFLTLINILSVFQLFPFSEYLIVGATAALLSRLHCAWTHKLIAMPSAKGLRARVASAGTFKQLALPAAVNAVAMQASADIIVVASLATRWSAHDVDAPWPSAAKWFAMAALALFITFFVVLPNVVVLIQIEASTLPENEETIVPFDRSFGGKVVPVVLGGTGVVTAKEAWKAFSWGAWRRLLKVYVKMIFIMIAVSVVALHVFAFEIYAIMGDALRVLVTSVMAQMGSQGTIGGQ